MISSTLGKRTRSSVDSPYTRPSTRSFKPSAQVPVFNDENDNPFISRKKTKPNEDVRPTEHRGHDYTLAGEEDASTPVKHSVVGGRLALSPSKINSQFKTTKPISASKKPTTQVVTPQTPRHRDALSKKVPVTPRHRVGVVGKPWTPRTPRTPSTPSNSVPTVYNCARQLFVRSAHPGRLIGRETERSELHHFLEERITAKIGGCLYVSGPPGTGKSALVNEVRGEFEIADSVHSSHINCMSIRNARDIFGKLIEDLLPNPDGCDGNELTVLQKIFTPKRKTGHVYVVTLDEIDHLLTLDLELVYTLFGWSLQKASQLILLGIANALDFTDRFLPRLKARHLKPQLLPFLPYAAPQITSVISNRLRSLLPSDTSAPADFVPFMHPAAAQLCARKVASQTGDIRKAFDICRRAIELVEGETVQKHQQQLLEHASPSSPSRTPLMENTNLSSSPMSQSPARSPVRASKHHALAESLSQLTAETAPRATIAHVARITSAAFGNGISQRLQSLNLQQKAALCALVAWEKKKRALSVDVMATPSKSDRSAPTIGALFEMYAALCRRDGMLHPLTSTEFRDVIGSLETLSLVSAIDGRNGTFVGMSTPSKRGRGSALLGATGDDRRIGSCVGEKELDAAVDGVAGGILRGLLHGEEF